MSAARFLSVSVLALALTACGGGGGGEEGASLTQGTVAPPVTVTPPVAGLCAATPVRGNIGPFRTQAGDCFVHYRVTNAELGDFEVQASTGGKPDLVSRLVADLRLHFQEEIDSVVVMMDAAANTLAVPFAGVNYPIQSCSIHEAGCPRFARLGVTVLPARNYLVEGPALHELLHGFLNGMYTDGTAGFILPTTVASHWGYSGANGQLGGWDPSTLVASGGGVYQAASFGPFANGGNGIAYSNLELWTMGLLADTELLPVDVAEDPVASSSTTFTASAIRNYNAADILARVPPHARPHSGTSPRSFRGLVVVLSTRDAVDATVLAQLNLHIAEFSMQAEPTLRGSRGVIHNFWSATGRRASLTLAGATALAR